MNGADRARKAVVAESRETVRLFFAEAGVGRDDGESGALRPRGGGAIAQDGERIDEAAVGAARGGDDGAVAAVDDLAAGVNGGDRRDDEASEILGGFCRCRL